MPATITLYIPTAYNLRTMPSSPEGEDWAVLDVRGGSADLRMFLPTAPLAKLEGAYWTEWIIAIQGPVLARTDASPKQRDALLDMVYAFNIFTDGHPHVDRDHYPVFIAKIIEIATSNPPFAPVDSKLGELAALAHKLIPQDVWNVYVLPPPPNYPVQLFGSPSAEESEEWARAFIETWREARAHLFHSPAHAVLSSEHALLFAPPPLPPTSPTHSLTESPPLSTRASFTGPHSPAARSDGDSIPPPLEPCPTSESKAARPEADAATTAASHPHPHDVLDSDYESDDSMPSLRTVDGSSDSDFKEDERVERARELRSHVDRFMF